MTGDVAKMRLRIEDTRNRVFMAFSLSY